MRCYLCVSLSANDSWNVVSISGMGHSQSLWLRASGAVSLDLSLGVWESVGDNGRILPWE